MEYFRLTAIRDSIHYFYLCGIHNDDDLKRIENYVNEIKTMKENGSILPSLADTLIKEGETAIERRYTYLEEVASLGNNWW